MVLLTCAFFIEGSDNGDTVCVETKEILQEFKKILGESFSFRHMRYRRASLPIKWHLDLFNRTKSHLDDMNNSDVSLPWSCQSRVTWRDLGPQYFPRYVRDVVCLQSKCSFEKFSCQERPYSIKVLHLTDPGSCHLPSSSAPKWKMQDVKISLCCECSFRTIP